MKYRFYGFTLMIYFLLITAFTVSIDAFACGFSLSFLKGKKILIVTSISLTVFAMCLVTNYLATVLNGLLTEKISCLGGLILIGVGIFNLLKKDEKTLANNHGVFTQSLFLGFAVGLDGAVANLSLAIMGINAFYVPLIIALMHALTISLGILLARSIPVKKLGKIKFLPPLVLILLGAYKTLGFFI